MDNYLLYIVKVNIVFTILYLFYYLVFNRLTFYSLNRLFLIAIIPFSFIIPALNLGITTYGISMYEIPVFEGYSIPVQQNAVTEINNSLTGSIGQVFLILYIVGLLFYVFRLVLNSFRLYRTKHRSPIRNLDGFLLIETHIPVAFSWFKWIFIPQNKEKPCDPAIIEHEKIHAYCKHSIDLILTELFIAVVWFNPVVFFFRKSIKSNHEFQVDDLVLKLGINKAGYLRLIHDQLEFKTKLIGLYNYFNGLTIKKRIDMITKNKSNKKQLLRYFFIIPLMVILTASFSSRNGSVPELFPIKKGEYAKITSRYGKEFKNPATNKITVHNGIDIKADEGVAVMATADGIIIKMEKHEGYGNLVIIDHGEGFQSLYAHLRNFNTEKDRIVKKGEVIGYVGNTGYSTAPHLHFEIRLNDEKVDPEKYVGID